MGNQQGVASKVKWTLGALVIATVIYIGVAPFLSGGRHMKQFCLQITPQMTSGDLHALLKQTDYKVMERGEGEKTIVTIVDKKAMGRFTCRVTVDEGNVAGADYVLND